MKILGHRGVITHNKIPYQNTIEAINQAILVENADGVEIDVFSSSDGEIFVIHDNEISKHSDIDSGQITNNVSRETWRKLVGFNGNYYKIPTLTEVLFLFRDRFIGKTLNIEIKQEGVTKSVLDCIEKSQINSDNVIISSFKHSELIKVRESNKNIKIGILFDKKYAKENKLTNLIDKLSPNVCLNPYFKIFNESIYNSELEKYFWTVNFDNISDEDLENMMNLPNVNIISNEPLLFRRKIEALSSLN